MTQQISEKAVKAKNGIAEVLDYLKTGGLGEVIGLADIAVLMNQPKVQMDTDMALALCQLANETLCRSPTVGAEAEAVVCEQCDGTGRNFNTASSQCLRCLGAGHYYLASPSSGAGVDRDGVIEASRVAEAMEDGKGAWIACAGCQESVDGYVNGNDYPYSEVFKCQPGAGCSECGGIGVVWDTTDYSDYADFALEDMLKNDFLNDLWRALYHKTEMPPNYLENLRKIIDAQPLSDPEDSLDALKSGTGRDDGDRADALVQHIARLICRGTSFNKPDDDWTEDTLEYGLRVLGKNWQRYEMTARLIVENTPALSTLSQAPEGSGDQDDGWQDISKMAEAEAVRERLREAMLRQPTSEHGRETYSDGFAQGLAYAIFEIDRAALSPSSGTGVDRDGVIEDLRAIPQEALKALGRQDQLDEDGIMVGVSRQALDEVLPALEKAVHAAWNAALKSGTGRDDGGRELRATRKNEREDFEQFAKVWRQTAETICTMLGLPGGLGAEEMPAAVQQYLSALSQAPEGSGNQSSETKRLTLERIFSRTLLPAPENQTMYDMRVRIGEIHEIAKEALSNPQAEEGL
jgi:hypothetical protein